MLCGLPTSQAPCRPPHCQPAGPALLPRPGHSAYRGHSSTHPAGLHAQPGPATSRLFAVRTLTLTVGNMLALPAVGCVHCASAAPPRQASPRVAQAVQLV